MASPFIVAVSGGSGSGKTTFVRQLSEKLKEHLPLVISIDHYYRDLAHLEPSERNKQNFDDPNAIESELLREHIVLLRQGIAVERPSYDFATHTRRSETKKLDPSNLIIIDGIFSLCFPDLIEVLDLKIFLEVDDDIRVVRRISRDMTERGRSFENCAEQYLNSVRSMHLKHIEPTKKYADLLVPWHGKNEKSLDTVAAKIFDQLKKRAEGIL